MLVGSNGGNPYNKQNFFQTFGGTMHTKKKKSILDNKTVIGRGSAYADLCVMLILNTCKMGEYNFITYYQKEKMVIRTFSLQRM